MDLDLPILRRMCLADDPVVDRALAEALPTADAPTRRALVATLLERAHPAGLAGLIVHFHILDEPAQRLVVTQVDRLDDSLRLAADDPQVQTRLNVAEIVDRAGQEWLAYLLTGLLHTADARLHRAASRSLLRMARRHGLDAGSTPPPDAKRRRQLYKAVVEACACFHQHRRRDVLLAAACYAPRFGDDLLKHISDRHAPAHAAMCEQIAQADDPIICRAMLAFVSIESMQSAATRGLENRRATAMLGPITQLAHLLHAPRVLTGTRHAHRVEHLAPRHNALASLDRDCHRRLPGWINVLAIDKAARRQALAELAADRDAVVRLLALKQLIAMADDAADQEIATLCFDTESAIARIALRHLLRRRWSGLSQIMVRLIGSAHAELRHIAERQLGPIGFDRFWRNWAHIAPGTRAAAGRALMKIDPNFGRQLAHRMNAENVDHRLRAIMIARELGQETFFEEQLLARAEDDDARVASAAVKALAPLGPTRRVVAVLKQALAHENDRVRSNAIESLQAMQQVDSLSQALVELTQGRGNRSRATAIKALLELPMAEALPELLRMLADDDAEHRVSALWVVERMGLLPVVNSVAQLAQQDPQPQVRRRAVRVVRDLAASHLAQQKGSA